jgi:glycosyltransferase involved in cell wall biosynthesis
MMRVLHVSQPTEAGVARVVGYLLADQVRAGWDVLAACPPDGPLAAAAGRAGAGLLPWPATRQPGPAVLGEVARLARLVARVRPDLVHLHSSKAGLAGRLVLRGRVPTVFQPNGWSFLAASGALRSAAVTWERYATRWTHRVVHVSQRERDDAERLGIGGPAVVVPNGVDTEEFAAQDDTARARARAALGLDAAPTAVCVGRLCRQKGQDVLLAAWPRAVAAVPDARLVLVGDGPDRAALSAAAPPGVRFAGPTADPRPWYAAADVVVLPSRWEGLSLVQLEAMASARCVVGTDVGGVREALPDAATVVPVADAAALAAALATRLAHPALAAAEAAAGRERARARYDVRRVTQRMREIYADVIAGTPGGGEAGG